jgi:hypothetical protein
MLGSPSHPLLLDSLSDISSVSREVKISSYFGLSSRLAVSKSIVIEIISSVVKSGTQPLVGVFKVNSCCCQWLARRALAVLTHRHRQSLCPEELQKHPEEH